MQEIEWKEGVPSLEGLYFIAVKMGPAAYSGEREHPFRSIVNTRISQRITTAVF